MKCIERDSIYEVLTSLLNDIEDDTEHSTEFANGFEQALRCAADKIADIPVADVRPERHGRWQDADMNGDFLYKCSECGDLFYPCDDGEIYFKFCPNCGAKMDGKDVTK